MNGTCGDCVFYRPEEPCFPDDLARGSKGACKRFPKPETTYSWEWCGEFKPIQKSDPEAGKEDKGEVLIARGGLVFALLLWTESLLERDNLSMAGAVSVMAGKVEAGRPVRIV